MWTNAARFSFSSYGSSDTGKLPICIQNSPVLSASPLNKRFNTNKMSFKLALVKLVKPVTVATVAVVSAYGYREWDKAKNALKLSVNDKDMTVLFDKLDSDHSGYIDKGELREALKQSGVKVNYLSLEAMMKAADENGDGKISREEWLHMCHHIFHDSSGEVPHPTAAPPAPPAVVFPGKGEKFAVYRTPTESNDSKSK